MPVITSTESHYDADYFNWEKEIAEFGAWAGSFRFQDSIRPTDAVIDFGCGGGYLLHKLKCRDRIGIDPNPSTVDAAVRMNVRHFFNSRDARRELGDGFANVIISSHALEHTANPLQEMKDLYPLLKPGGIIHFLVPCDSVTKMWSPNDINQHLFSWSPMNLGNLFTHAGYQVEYAAPYIHKWPPHYQKISKLGWPLFNLACRIYAHIERSVSQTEVRARKPAGQVN
jgi:SAM-dependent methyltransferase